MDGGGTLIEVEGGTLNVKNVHQCSSDSDWKLFLQALSLAEARPRALSLHPSLLDTLETG